MDPLTQAALGAAAGHVLFHRQFGRRALAVGAVAGAFPDIDAFWGLFDGPFGRLVSHRGITHSLFFGPVVGFVAGWCGWRFARPRSPPPTVVPELGHWTGLCVVALMSHPLLDWFTTFGTQLLAPLSRERFALDAIAVVDPAYTLILALGLATAMLAERRRYAGYCTGLALLLSTAYLFAGLAINARAEQEARRQLDEDGVAVAEIHAFPTMLQLPHRRIVAITADDIRVGFVSTWRPCPIAWGTAPRLRDRRIDAILATEEGRIYAWFANGLLSAAITEEGSGASARLVDLRYGYVADPLQGLWGITARFDSAGRMLGLPERYSSRPEISRENVGRLIDDAFPSDCGPSGPS